VIVPAPGKVCLGANVITPLLAIESTLRLAVPCWKWSSSWPVALAVLLLTKLVSSLNMGVTGALVEDDQALAPSSSNCEC
jgi:hypothetical protein